MCDKSLNNDNFQFKDYDVFISILFFYLFFFFLAQKSRGTLEPPCRGLNDF